MRPAWPIAIAMLAFFAGAQACAQNAKRPLIEGPLNTLKDVQEAVKKCWVWPPVRDTGNGMDITVLLSFKRNGEIFGGRVTYQSPDVSDDVKAAYYRALAATIRRCSPLPFSESLGEAIAGKPFNFHFIDDRKQKRA